MNSTLKQRVLRWIAAGVITLVSLSIQLSGIYSMSPTYNEPAHLVAGMMDWKTARFNVYVVNTPLVRMTAALPVIALWGGVTVEQVENTKPGARPEFTLANRYVQRTGRDIKWQMAIARMACLPFFFIGAYVAFTWAKEFWDCDACGWVALILWCTEPTLVTQSELITSDCAASAFGLASGYAYWRWRTECRFDTTVFFGLCLGLAMLSKLTWILGPAMFLLQSLIESVIARQKASCRSIAAFVAAMMLALLVLNVGYGFTGSFHRLDSFDFLSRSLSGNEASTGNRFRGTALGAIRLPLPGPFVEGLDLQRCDFEAPHATFAAGHWYESGVWWYYLYGLCVKTPHAHQVLFIATVLVLVFQRSSGPYHNWAAVFGPPFFLIALASLHHSFTNHYRYVTPAIGFLIVFTAGLASRVHTPCSRRLIALALTQAALSLALSTPHHLAYFNELSGGVTGCSSRLLHSSLDWGQDLWHLEAFAQSHPHLTPIRLCVKQSLPPEWVGISRSNIRTSTIEYNESISGEFGTYCFERTDYSMKMLHGALTVLEDRGRKMSHVGTVGTSLVVIAVNSLTQADQHVDPDDPAP